MKPARVWRALGHRYRHEAARCSGCGKILYPPRPSCPACNGRAFEPHRLKDTGRVVTFTVQHITPDEFADLAPYAVGVIELDDGVRITAQITDIAPADLRCGQRVRLVFRRIQEEGASGVIAYGHKAVPE